LRRCRAPAVTLKGLLRFGFPNMKPKKRGGVTIETPHEESEGRNLGMIISPKDRLLL